MSPILRVRLTAFYFGEIASWSVRKGEFLAQAGNDRPENMVVEIDMERSENVRRWWPFLRDRRIDEYEGLTKRFWISERIIITIVVYYKKGPQSEMSN